MGSEEIRLSIMELKVLAEIFHRNNPRETYEFAESMMVNLKQEEQSSIDYFLDWLGDKIHSKSFKQLIQILDQA
tara:strand:- start:270 stop:491 length:222 start_codon:yes stop_codon:yes gene_type:complete